jgi:hypothetical protein
MPKIVVMADASDGRSSAVLWSERVTPELLVSGHYAAQLVERMRWALKDAPPLEHTSAPSLPGRADGDHMSSGGTER